ncbi:MAG TPA: hypothetical protein VM536_04200 [Chloroflexia bacterium]|nr:hypothetical protein [Chloroflexia bacterium]
MSRKARRHARRGGSSLLPAGPRWTRFSRALRGVARSSARTARRRRNELLITSLYALAGALCLALAALLLTNGLAPAATSADGLSAPPDIRATVIGAVSLGGGGILLLGLAARSFRRWRLPP